MSTARRVLLWTVAVAVLAAPLAVVAVLVWRQPPAGQVPLVAAAAPVPPATAVPAPAPSGVARTAPQTAYAEWASRIAAATGIPATAVAAYGHAEVLLGRERPGCRLSWATLAGVARVESDHGRFGGRTLRPDGSPDRPIVGVALDGSPGVAAIPDTDGAAYDGDPRWDRAVGPLQFIPGTWRSFAADGDGDGAADPQDVDDAAVAAARYLCSGGADLSTVDGWRAAVLRYNASADYAAAVLSAGNTYAEASMGGA